MKPVIRTRYFEIFEPPTNDSITRFAFENMTTERLAGYHAGVGNIAAGIKNAEFPPEMLAQMARQHVQIARELEGRGFDFNLY